MNLKRNLLKGFTFAGSMLTICLGLISLNQVKAGGTPGYEKNFEVTCADGSEGYFCRINMYKECNVSGQDCGC